jgi:hypothetical protein
VHAPEQQTPSTQIVLEHCEPVVQAAPFGSRSVHDPDWQLKPLAQSALTEQVVRHAPAAHA